MTQPAPTTQASTTTGAATTGTAPQFASLYVGDLVPEVTEAVLYEIFNTVGPVASIRVCRDSVTRRSLGYSYVNYHSASDADRAMEALNFSEIKGHPCRIMWSHRDPTIRRSGASNVFVKNLDKSIDNRALFDTFSNFGNILSCKVATDPDGKSRGFGFVHYEADESATQAVEKLNGMQIGDKTVYVGPFLKSAERDTGEKHFTNIYIKNLPQDWDEEKLRQEFEVFGETTSIAVKIDPKGRRFGFINYKEFDSAKDAVTEMHGRDLRTAAEKEKTLSEDEIAQNEALKEDNIYPYQLYVARAQTKSERQNELKQKFQTSISQTAPTKFAGANLYVKNLSETVDDDQLMKMFEPFGKVNSVKVMRDEKGDSRGFGFVCFATPEEATEAVTRMHLKLIDGKPLYVALHERREQRMERLQQRYRMPVNNMPGGMMNMQGGMMGGPNAALGHQMGGGMGPAGMMAAAAMRGGMGPHQMAGMYGMPPQQMYYSGMPNRNGQMMQPQQAAMMGGQRMPGGMMHPGQQGQFPQRGMQGGMQQQMSPYMMNPQQAASMRGGNMMQQQGGNRMIPGPQPGGIQRPGGPMPMRPNPNVQSQMMGGNRNMPHGMNGQYQFNAQARNNAMMPQSQSGNAAGWPEYNQFDPQAPLTAAALAAAPPAMQKQMLGEKLFPSVTKFQPELAGKITGMMLEMDNSELLILLESEHQLRAKIDEALRVLHGQQ